MKRRSGVVATIAFVMSFFSVITASVAWFEAKTDVEFGTGHGSTAASYFESGAGTQDSPYVISSPVHMYNLAWLQYLGQFNTELCPTYFSLKNDIDMSGLESALPPIGTQTYPFIGIFNGNAHTISNLTVSNNVSDLSKKPSTVDEITGCEVIGFFGIVGNPSPIGIEKGDGLNYVGLNVYEKLRVANFNLQNVVIKSSTDKTLMGVVAGYLNGEHGTVHDIGVYNGSLQAKSGVQAINHFTTQNIISKYSLIGETEDTVWRQAYTDSISGGGSQGDSAAFGGSVDMQTLARRLNYMVGSSHTDLTTAGNYTFTATSKSTSAYNLNVQVTGDVQYNPFDWQTPVGAYVDLKKDTYLPINIDNQEMGLFDSDGNITTASQTSVSRTYTTSTGGTSTYTTNWSKKTLKTNTEYNTKSYEQLGTNNTGFFVGSSSSSPRLKNSALNATPSIPLSLGYATSTAASSYTYNASKFEMAAIDSSGSFRIQDEQNASSSSTQFSGFGRKTYETAGFVNYTKVRSYLEDVFSSTGALYGIRFQFKPSTSSTITKSVNLNGTTIQNYTLFDGAVNFNLKQAGRVTIAAGTYASASTNTQSIGSIYSVSRTGGTVAAPVEITNVYQNSAGDILTNQSSAPSGYTKVYDYSWYNNSLKAGAVYYLEIPLPAGDYLIAKASIGNSSYSAYMMYLDIGANGSGGDEPGQSLAGYYDLRNIRYIHSLTENTVSGTNYMDILFEITTAGANGTVALYFARQSAGLLYYHQDGTASNVTLRVYIATNDYIADSETAVF